MVDGGGSTASIISFSEETTTTFPNCENEQHMEDSLDDYHNTKKTLNEQSLSNLLSRVFYRIGKVVSAHSYKSVLVSVIVALLTGLLTLKYFRFETDTIRLWVPIGSESLNHRDFISKNFNDILMPGDLLVTPREKNETLASKSLMLDYVSILKHIESFEFVYNNTVLSFQDVCVRRYLSLSNSTVSSYCYLNSILDVFWDKTFVFSSNDTFVDIVARKLEVMEEEDIIATLSQDSLKNSQNHSLDKESLIGGYDDIGAKLMVKSFASKYVLVGDTSSQLWEEALLNEIRSYNHQQNSLNIYTMNESSLAQAEAESVETELLVYFSFVMALLYVCGTLGRVRCREVRLFAPLSALFSIILAIVTTTGIGSTISSYGPVHRLIVPILFAVGLDDAFVIMSAYDDELVMKCEDINDQMGVMLSKTGPSITVTSLTNAFGFFLASRIPIPAVRYFALWAGVGLIIDLFFQSTFFVACIAIGAKRRRKKFKNYGVNDNNELHSISLSNHESIKPIPMTIMPRLYSKFGPLILNRQAKVFFIIIAIIILALCAYGTVQLKEKDEPKNYYRRDSIQHEYMAQMDEYFSVRQKIYTVESNINFSDGLVQELMVAKYDPVGGHIVQMDNYVDDSLSCWFNSFRDYLNITNHTEVVETQLFDHLLLEFLESTAGKNFVYDILIDEKTGTLSTARCHASFYLEYETDKAKVLLAQMDNNFGSSVPGSFAYAERMLLFEGWIGLLKNLHESLALSLISVLIVSLLLIGSVIVSLIIFFSVIASVVDMLGIIDFLDINLNALSYLAVIAGVGLAVDFSAHIGYAFVKTEGITTNERILKVLREVGPPVTHAGFSSLVCLFVCVFSKNHIIYVQAWLYITIILLGMFHGIIIVPILISIFGPTLENTPPPRL